MNTIYLNVSVERRYLVEKSGADQPKVYVGPPEIYIKP